MSPCMPLSPNLWCKPLHLQHVLELGTLLEDFGVQGRQADGEDTQSHQGTSEVGICLLGSELRLKE